MTTAASGVPSEEQHQNRGAVAAEDPEGTETRSPVGTAEGPGRIVLLLAALRRAVAAFRLPWCSQSLVDLARYSFRDALESTVSLFSNVFAIFLGTALTALLLALMAGTESYIHYLFSVIPGVDSVTVWVDYSTGEEPLTPEEAGRLEDWPGVQKAVPAIGQFVPLYRKKEREVVSAMQSSVPGDPELERLNLVAGSAELDPTGWQIVIPRRVAEQLDNFDPEGLVGQEITMELRRYSGLSDLQTATPTAVHAYPVSVIGIVQQTPEDRVYGSLNMVRFVRDFATARTTYIPEAKSPLDESEISAESMFENVRLCFASPAQAEQAYNDLDGALDGRLDASWPGRRMLYLRDVQTVSTLVLMGIGLLTIVAGSVSIFNTLLASVARKTKEIGILRALGVSQLDVFVMVLGQAVVVGALACLMGLVVACAGSGALNATVMQHWERQSEHQQLSLDVAASGGLFQFSYGIAGLLIVAVMTICVAAAVVPAFHASRKTPADALRAD